MTFSFTRKSSLLASIYCAERKRTSTHAKIRATEPTLLVLIVIQTVILAIEAAPSVYTHPRPTTWGDRKARNWWLDYALLALFMIYTYVGPIRIQIHVPPGYLLSS